MSLTIVAIRTNFQRALANAAVFKNSFGSDTNKQK